ncbi:sugar ABC transporter ATP-binding protein [Pseudofrankia sp. BMG5.37]|uniref:sugar ABC transporter ATP-binding protein n=1 Tax=Pseudofrankia sp. BMG5.37 TaxID=3050035 RepID=UPI0028958F86|nr:sugar ABC transporter ATP-binding protein [Pseudofrankia sp. BMG5.37]MDT3444673.1 sugar ABC transporter ATP-binding protein [Pseudofrankia sp. BMG5.37]
MKSFGANKVLKGVDLQIRGGEFVGLMGPNGAGKSTLIKILAGVYEATSGEIRLGGKPVRSLASSSDVGFIHQDLGLIDGLTISDNLSLAQPPKRRLGPVLDKRAERAEAAQALRLVGLSMSVDTYLSDLTPGEKTLVAVARVMGRGANILVIDETTSALPPADAGRVIESLALAARSGATVIMVTHKLSEILNATDRVVVIIDGELVQDAPTAGLDRAALVEMLMQHESDAREINTRAAAGEEPTCVLELHDVCVGKLGPINLRLNAGEVIGISGLPGSGLHDIAFLVNGSLKPERGEVVAHRQGLKRALVPPYRESQGGFGALSVRENLSVSSLWRWRRRGARLLSPRRELRDCAKIAADLSVRPRPMDVPFDTLSGGNKQKVIFGRALLAQPHLYVLCEPTRGVDVGTRSEIYRLIREMAASGAAVLVASSDAEDLFSVCDRVALVVDGRLQRLRQVTEMTASELELMV